MLTLNWCAFFPGKDFPLALPAAHAVPVCDTTSYFFDVIKVKILQKLLTCQGQENNKAKLELVDVEKVK